MNLSKLIKMKKLHSFTLLVLLFAGTSSLLLAQDARAQLSMEEKLSDFEYLYAELKASYPYFEINKRKYGVDWLGSKATFIEKIEATEDDKAYVRVMQEIAISTKFHP